MKVITNAVDDLEDVVTDMHKLIRLESSDAKLKVEHLDINSLIDPIIDSYALIIKKRKQKLVINKCDESLIVLADRTHIKGIISELVQNAVKFTDNEGEIIVTTRPEGEYGVLSVKDNGIGIEASEKGKIFEKFYEIQDSNHHHTSKVAFMGGGLGLGLPSVRAMVEAHGGGIKVMSEEGKGSEFIVYLPLHNEVD
jgi:signal transduction histidine kinase